MTARGHAARRVRALLVTALMTAATSAACTPGQAAHDEHTSAPAASTIAASAPSATRSAPPPAAVSSAPGRGPASPSSPAAPTTLAVTEEPWHLPAPLSREVVMPDDGGLLVVGGLTANGSTSQVLLVDPATGAVTSRPPLAQAVHDAAGATVAGKSFLFAGGNTTTVGIVQELRPDQPTRIVASLPTRRSDLTAVTRGPDAYLVGGYDGATIQPSVLVTTDGVRFQAIARLPVPVRYAAVAVAGDSLWVFGGEHAGALTAAIQRVDLTSGKATVVGKLAAATDGVSAFVLDGQVYLAGGQTSGGSSDHVWRFDPATGAISAAGRLPYPVANPGAVTVGDVGYLVGGETPARTNRVVALRLSGPRG